MNLILGTEVIARGLRWEVIDIQLQGNQTRMCCPRSVISHIPKLRRCARQNLTKCPRWG